MQPVRYCKGITCAVAPARVIKSDGCSAYMDRNQGHRVVTENIDHLHRNCVAARLIVGVLGGFQLQVAIGRANNLGTIMTTVARLGRPQFIIPLQKNFTTRQPFRLQSLLNYSFGNDNGRIPSLASR